jgi:cytochrome c oxidase subunit 1
MYPEPIARFAAVLMFFGFNFTFFPQYIMGWAGMPRRYGAYPPEFQIYHVLSTGGAGVLGVAYLLPLGYLTWSLFFGRKAPANPWKATGLEWQTASPPPKHNFDKPPTVDTEPYAYHRRRDAPEYPEPGHETDQMGGPQ